MVSQEGDSSGFRNYHCFRSLGATPRPSRYAVERSSRAPGRFRRPSTISTSRVPPSRPDVGSGTSPRLTRPHPPLWSRDSLPMPQVGNKMTAWSARTSAAEAIARAGGRRRYNASRSFNAILRRAEVIRRLGVYGPGRGSKARIARELGVSRSTVTRDVQAVVDVHRHPCPTCSTVIEDREWERIARDRSVDLNPLSMDGMADIRAQRAVQGALPRILSDLGFWVDGETVTHPDIPAVAEREVAVERLVAQVCAEAFR